MVDLDYGSSRFYLRMFDHLRKVVNGADRNSILGQHQFPLVEGSGEEYLLQPRNQFLAITGAVGIGAKTWVVGEFGASDHGAKRFPQFFAAHGKRQIARLGLECLVGQQCLVRSAHRLWDFASSPVI